MNEKTLCAALTKTLRAELKGCVVFKHNDRTTAGIPDLSVTWGGKTTWLEVKYQRRGTRIQLGVQHRTCALLAANGSCFYVVYDEISGRTILMHPGSLPDFIYTDFAQDFNHGYVVEKIRSLHGG